ncbi:MAG: hypothetical protein WAQ29_02520 [Nitrososphaeraceae archaeon]
MVTGQPGLQLHHSRPPIVQAPTFVCGLDIFRISAILAVSSLSPLTAIAYILGGIRASSHLFDSTKDLPEVCRLDSTELITP